MKKICLCVQTAALISLLVIPGPTAADNEGRFRKMYSSSSDMTYPIALHVLSSQQSMMAARDYDRAVRMAMRNTSADEETAERLVDFIVTYRKNIDAETQAEIDLVACKSASSRANGKAAQRTLNDLDDLRLSLYEKHWIRAKATLSGQDMKALKVWLDNTKLRTTWAQLEHENGDESRTLENLENYCADRLQQGG